MHDETSAVGMKEQQSFQNGNPDIFEPKLHNAPYPTSAALIYVRKIRSAKGEEITFIRPQPVNMHTDQTGAIYANLGPSERVARISNMLAEKQPISIQRYIEIFKEWFEDSFCVTYLNRSFSDNITQWIDHVQWHPRPVIDEESTKWIAYCPACDGNRYLSSRMVEFGVPFSMQYDKCRECDGTGVVARKSLQVVARHITALGKKFIIKEGVE